MRKSLKFGMFLVCMTLPILLTTACGQQDRLRSNSVPPADNSPVKTEAVTDAGGTTWVPLTQVAHSLGLRVQETEDRANLGFSDVMFTVQPSQRHAVSFGRPISLPQAPVRENGQVYMTMDSVSALIQSKARLDSRTGALAFDRITPAGSNVPPQTGTSRYGILGVAENRDEMVAYAKQYLGVPYEFGAPPYEQSKTFDCSSYTRHVFKKFGQDLPRLARDQAKEGVSVSRSELQVGDLIFFTVPGRFKSDNIAGHVGIYIGDGKFIHTWGSPGVQISPLDSGYWSDVIISMRRVR
ncbi:MULTISPECIES: C40 family peptidase [Paenibacillus]|uniref:C40 family peptidase n=1 Tax=Paenibacillus TaxID=44249 RepID=UPI00073F15BE|nr:MULTISPECIES: C40 family peptidase [Paenibacillus]MDU4695252.1 NlpC/P60 family protein [Paenibacillus sp.]